MSNRLTSKWTDATQATRTSQFDIIGVNSAAAETYANFQTGGIVRVNNLADTLATKAYARSLGGGGGSGTVNTGTANTLAYYPSTGTTVDDLTAITANRALISDANGLPIAATTTATEIGYVNGVTSAIQTQINTKQATITFGTGVQTALGVNIGSAGAPVLFNGAGGTPTSMTLTSATGLPLTTGVTGVLPVANGGTNSSSASITAFNNITGYTASGATGTTSTNLVFSTSPTITTPTVSGTITTTAAAQNGTNASGIGGIPYVHHIFVRSDETLSNSNADQNLFTNTAHDVITVLANTTYRFEGSFDLTHGATSHSLALGFTPTTATVTNIAYNTVHWATAVGTQTASQVTTRVKATATTAINSALANATETVTFSGWITIGNTGGTITPQIKFSADPTGTILLKAGAEFHIWAVGNDTFTEQGPIN